MGGQGSTWCIIIIMLMTFCYVTADFWCTAGCPKGAQTFFGAFWTFFRAILDLLSSEFLDLERFYAFFDLAPAVAAAAVAAGARRCCCCAVKVMSFQLENNDISRFLSRFKLVLRNVATVWTRAAICQCHWSAINAIINRLKRVFSLSTVVNNWLDILVSVLFRMQVLLECP